VMEGCDWLLIFRFVVTAFSFYSSSKTYNTDGNDTLRELDKLINSFRSRGELILCGDFNARIATEQDFIENDTARDNNFIPLPDDYEPDNLTKRNSQDKNTNSYRRTFLELLINNSIHILNGRTLGDFIGGYTCIQPRGSSVVDYFIISLGVRNLVNYLTIMDFTAYSDHKPITLNLKININAIANHHKLHELYDKAPLRYKFCDNDKTNYITIQESEDMKTTVQDMTNKKPWFNKECRFGKRAVNKAAKIVSQFPDSEYLRKNFYKTKKHYKKLIKTKKSHFFDKLNLDIQQGKILNWKQFKRLKTHKTTKLQFDSCDMNNFEKYFKNLYNNQNSTISQNQKEELLHKADNINESNIHHTLLNKPISSDEINRSILNLKNGKSSSSDMICNEMIKYLNNNGIHLLEKLFNNCLNIGCYPWNNSIISPLHKKGNKEDPDNYRAVAVSSAIGKLFSTILLDRLIEFRKQNCPDPPNQLGFTKGAQTYDHVFTLNTITSKYKKLGKRVYAVFVDFKKAFDSVCREALFYKLSQSGITGKFYNVLRHMYTNSTAQIKMSGHVSKIISINKGTEQGHPLSPDLFKAYLSDLSPLLEKQNCPQLLDTIISHLLWADDLIILALDEETIQNQLNELNQFCSNWGVEININKTKLMIFNDSPRHPPMTHSLHLGNNTLIKVDSYCYLGINIHKSGSLSTARHELKNKATRALYSLMNTVNKTKLSYTSLCNLFDTLIKPIVLYGAPIWCPSMSIVKHLGKISNSLDNMNNIPLNIQNLARKISLTNCEKVHLKFLKWALGINRRASNIGTWGESGRYPLIYESLNLTMKYVERIKSCDSSSFVSCAFKEQQLSQLEWFRHIEPILKLDSTYTSDHVTAYNATHKSSPITSIIKHPSDFLIHNGFVKRIPSQVLKPIRSQHFTTHLIMKTLKSRFRQIWTHTKDHSPKLEFYSRVKSEFRMENYLNHVDNFYNRSNLTKLRTSAHELEIELGRRKGIARQERNCKWCKISMDVKIVEDEDHLLHKCDLYSSMRNSTRSRLANFDISNSVNFMELLLRINHTDNISSSRSSTTQTQPQHINMGQDHGEISTANVRSQTHNPIDTSLSPVIVITNTIAKFVTRCFNHRKKFSYTSTPT
ncbi:MAG: RNA-directed DNA polymerase, partial [Saccharospirillaceae bacterium]|nr:RNA-directed DNA polymerase [Saccharospirillaceae bacterium]